MPSKSNKAQTGLISWEYQCVGATTPAHLFLSSFVVVNDQRPPVLCIGRGVYLGGAVIEIAMAVVIVMIAYFALFGRV